MKLSRISILLLALVLILVSGCIFGGGDKVKEYTISGTVINLSGGPIDGVILSISGDKDLVIDTFDENGGWSAVVEGSVTVKPSHEDYTFEPKEIVVTKANSEVNFTGSYTGPYTISGTVTDENQDPIDNVVLIISGTDTDLEVVDFDDDGAWSAEVIGSVTVTPKLEYYVFAPDSLTVGSPSEGIDFVGTYLELFNISGTVVDEEGEPLPGALVVITGYNDDEVTADEEGAWSAEVRGPVSVTAVVDGLNFETIVVEEAKDNIVLMGTEDSMPELILHYTFDDVEDGIVLDSSPNGFNGEVCGNPDFVPGLFGNALACNGEDAYVGLVKNYFSFGEYPNFTLSLWIKPKTLGNWTMIFTAYAEQDMLLGFLEDKLGMFWGTYMGWTKTFAVPTNDWTHVAFSFGDELGTLYINGVEVAANELETTVDAMQGPFEIFGIGGGDHNGKFHGDLDDFRLFAGELTANQVLAIYNEAEF